MKVNVTEKHIRRGKRKHPLYCPVALAVKERSHKRVEAGPFAIFLLVNNKAVGEASTPTEVSDFMRHYDAEHTVEPFTFEVTFHKAEEL